MIRGVGWNKLPPGAASAFGIISLTNQSKRLQEKRISKQEVWGFLPLKFPREIFLEAGSPAEPPSRLIIRAGRALAEESPESRL